MAKEMSACGERFFLCHLFLLWNFQPYVIVTYSKYFIKIYKMHYVSPYNMPGIW